MTSTITKEQARKYMLLKQGLYGDYRFEGKEGVRQYLEQAGCVQYDPIDVCGKNHELVLQARVLGFSKDMAYDLLYVDRKLFDYWDKNMSIISVDDWPYFQRQRQKEKATGLERDEINEVIDELMQIVRDKGPICSRDLDYEQLIKWPWGATRLSRAVLETLYFQGELIIHHKKNTMKYYDLATNHISPHLLASPDPNATIEQYHDWCVLRRIGSVGLLWDKASDAWLGILDFKTKQRVAAFKRLLGKGQIVQIDIAGFSEPFYMRSEDAKYLDIILSHHPHTSRTELIAPLDNMLWDRRLIEEIFDFNYRWEIYTPAAKRKYGYYVLPILDDDRFVGRIEIVKDKTENQLSVKNLWWEADAQITRSLIDRVIKCLDRFGIFHGYDGIYISDGLFT